MITTPYNQDLIAAIATPPGEGGIAMVRLSGPGAVVAADQIFHGRTSLKKAQAGKLVYGHVIMDGIIIDEVLATVFKRPSSYTGEDVVEFSGHGGVYVSRRVLEAVLSAGVRLADPGEFTQRAFFNGRLDLAQAQAVADLIHARTESARRVAVAQLEGKLSQTLEGFRKGLLECCALLELELDFVEENIVAIDKTELMHTLQNLITELRALMGTYERGRICREGVKVVILGKPNVGKSSLLNALLARERAIVTDIPGTTRDTIEDQMDLDGLLVTLTDTAGIHRSDDPVEQEGVRRSEAAARQAGIVLVIVDGSLPLTPEDQDVMKMARELAVPMVLVINKSDLPSALDKTISQQSGETLRLSAKTGAGMEKLIQEIRTRSLGDGLPGVEDVVIVHLRHRDALIKAMSSILQALDSLDQNMSQEFVALDLRGALDALGEITGETTADDILHHIFASFCIGK